MSNLGNVLNVLFLIKKSVEIEIQPFESLIVMILEPLHSDFPRKPLHSIPLNPPF
jgi:hypothetical protein